MSESNPIIGGIDAPSLKQYIERIERLEAEKEETAQHIRDLFAQAKSSGFNPKIMKMILKERKLDDNDREETEALFDLYKKALGME